MDTGIDNGGKDGVTFEKFVFRKRRSVGGDRREGVEDMLKEEKELTKIDVPKLDMVSNAVQRYECITSAMWPTFLIWNPTPKPQFTCAYSHKFVTNHLLSLLQTNK